jgi:hypothetical protein
MRVAVEEHGGGQQLVRIWVRPFVSVTAVAVALMFAALATAAIVDRAWVAADVLLGMALALGLRTAQQAAIAAGTVQEAVERKAAMRPEPEPKVEERPWRHIPRARPRVRVRTRERVDD